MAILCPRCGEYTSIIDEHCKKCGFSIKNYLDNQKRLKKEAMVGDSDSVSSSICLKEEFNNIESMNIYEEKSDKIQENIMRLLTNVTISSNDEQKKENTLAKKEPVKIIAKKVADDVIILPPDRVKVEIEASKEGTFSYDYELQQGEIIKDREEYTELTDDIIEKKISQIKQKHAKEQEFLNKLEDMGMKEEQELVQHNVDTNLEDTNLDSLVVNKDNKIDVTVLKEEANSDNVGEMTKNDKVKHITEVSKENNSADKALLEFKAKEAEVLSRAVPCTEGYTFRQFLEEERDEEGTKKATLIIGGAILLIIVLIFLITFTVTANTM